MVLVVTTQLLLLVITTFTVVMIIEYAVHTREQGISTRPEYTYGNSYAVQFFKRPDKPVTFAIVLQTAECVPDYLMKDEYFGNHTYCNCDVFALSFKKPCNQTKFKHVFYIFDNKVMWSAGRNLALLQARMTHRHYLYYILMDDDVVLTYNEFTPREFIVKKIPPFKVFTTFLQDYQPAAAATDFVTFNNAGRAVNLWRTGCNKTDVPRVLPIGHMDACFDAFHRNVLDTVLPYPEGYDSRSHWMSTIHVSYALQIAFHGQLALFKEIKVHNPLHRIDDSQGMRYLGDLSIRRELLENIRKHTPPQYKNHSIFEKAFNYRIAGYDHIMCVDPPPPSSPIIPFRGMPNNDQLLAAYKLVRRGK